MPTRHAARRHSIRLTIVAGMLAALAAGAGLAGDGLYRDNPLVASGWRGNDVATLALALPVLSVSLLLEIRGSARARLVRLGMLLYLLYNYAFYLFGAALNPMFPAYAALVPVSFAALVFGLAGSGAAAAATLDPRAPHVVAAWLILLAVGLGGAHLAMMIAYLWTGRVPAIVVATEHPTNVVAALDLALVVAPSLPAAAWLFRGDPWGLVLAVLLNVKGAVYMAALTLATLSAARAGVTAGAEQAWLWAGLGSGCLAALAALLAPERRRGARPGTGVH